MTLFAAKSDATFVLRLVSLRHGMSVSSGSNIDTAARPNVYTEARVNYTKFFLRKLRDFYQTESKMFLLKTKKENQRLENITIAYRKNKWKHPQSKL